MPLLRHTTEHLSIAGGRRAFVTHYPPHNVWPTGLVIFLHQYSASSPAWCDQVGARLYSEQLGFVALCPQALGDSDPAAHEDGHTPTKIEIEGDAAGHKPPVKSYWRSFRGVGYWGKVVNDSVADLDLLEALVAWAHARVAVPPGRTFAFGCSNGGSLAYRAACERPHLFDGLAVYAQEYFDPSLGFMTRHLRQAPTTDAPASALAELRAKGGRAALGRCAPARTVRTWSGAGSRDEFYNLTAHSGWMRFSGSVLGCTDKPAPAVPPMPRGALDEDPPECEQRHECRGTAVATRHCTFNGRPHPGGRHTHSACFSGAIPSAWAFLTGAAEAPDISKDRSTTEKQPPAEVLGGALVWTKFAHCSKRCARLLAACRSTIADHRQLILISQPITSIRAYLPLFLARRRCREENLQCEGNRICAASWACEAQCYSSFMNLARYNRCFAQKCKSCEKLIERSACAGGGDQCDCQAGKRLYAALDKCSEAKCQGIGVPAR